MTIVYGFSLAEACLECYRAAITGYNVLFKTMLRIRLPDRDTILVSAGLIFRQAAGKCCIQSVFYFFNHGGSWLWLTSLSRARMVMLYHALPLQLVSLSLLCARGMVLIS